MQVVMAGDAHDIDVVHAGNARVDQGFRQE